MVCALYCAAKGAIIFVSLLLPALFCLLVLLFITRLRQLLIYWLPVNACDYVQFVENLPFDEW